jgi:hypothetical protein
MALAGWAEGLWRSLLHHRLENGWIPNGYMEISWDFMKFGEQLREYY